MAFVKPAVVNLKKSVKLKLRKDKLSICFMWHQQSVENLLCLIGKVGSLAWTRRWECNKGC